MSLQRTVRVTVNCCFMSKILPTWLNVSCRCRNWNIACPSCTSNFGLRCARLGRTGCPKLCLHMTWYDMIVKSSSTNMQTDIFPYTEHIFNCFSKDRGIQAPLCYELANSCLSLSALEPKTVTQLCCVSYKAYQCMWQTSSAQQKCLFVTLLQGTHITEKNIDKHFVKNIHQQYHENSK